MNIPDNVKPFVNDYKINVFEIAYMTPEEVEKFTSDFKIVADYFVQKRMKRDYKPINKAIKHVDELLKLMTVLTGDSRFEEQIKEMHKEKSFVDNLLKKKKLNLEDIFYAFYKDTSIFVIKYRDLD